jgi:DNA-binding response OmpR family regulator
MSGHGVLSVGAGDYACRTHMSRCKANMGNRPSVLIIEPQRSTRTSLEMTLSCEGMRVFSAISLGSALLQLRILQPDLIIVGFDGQELDESAAVTQIKALSPSPLLVLGRSADAPARPGIAGTLPYPLDMAQLSAKIAGLLDGHVYPFHQELGMGCLD